MGRRNSHDNEEDVLELETRKEIFEYVQANPGAHFSQLKRDLDMETGLVQHHLSTLEDYDVLTSEDHQGKRRLFVAEELTEEERAILSSLRYETTRHILLFLVEESTARNGAIAEELGVSPPTVSWHVSRLVENGIVSEVEDGRTTYYTVADEDLTMQLLVRYQESFVDRAVDNVLDFWG
ncbi:Winged helix-turn-helix DNA-binding [Halovenus aranensis]|uniref:Winged helix-turn-helix DNA-binding n=1 Tax=Halovenus aranensis TaxID=890420 RepID=A0A1G8SWK3_9EURY|nr:winged helix-turn-helix transcriptional regulator [Halovenus aranensis]SDJ33638.1 Winged helix-turn-helix DNA-binding [Halovenus aranensis]